MKTVNQMFLLALTSLMLVGLLSVSPSLSTAGCPTNIMPATPAWNSVTGYYTITGTNCVFEVKYCRRQVGGLWQYYIDEIKRFSGNCGSIKWVDIIDDIRSQILKEPAALPCDQHVMITVSLYTGQCIKFTYNGGQPIANFCGDAYCHKQCDLCTDPSTGQKVLQNCSTTVIGSADCENISGIEDITYEDTAELNNQWATSTCYFLGCSE